MKKISEHIILLRATSFGEACRQARSFFEKTTLVLYDTIEIDEAGSTSAEDKLFDEITEQGLAKNTKAMGKLLADLKESGVESITDLLTLPQGFASKTLHVLSHLLDGFIGIDSGFYSLVDDSHDISAKTADEIKETPEAFWVLSIHGFVSDPEDAKHRKLHFM